MILAIGEKERPRAPQRGGKCGRLVPEPPDSSWLTFRVYDPSGITRNFARAVGIGNGVEKRPRAPRCGGSNFLVVGSCTGPKISICRLTSRAQSGIKRDRAFGSWALARLRSMASRRV